MKFVVWHCSSIKNFCSSQCLRTKLNIVCINFGLGELTCILIIGGGLTARPLYFFLWSNKKCGWHKNKQRLFYLTRCSFCTDLFFVSVFGSPWFWLCLKMACPNNGVALIWQGLQNIVHCRFCVVCFFSPCLFLRFREPSSDQQTTSLLTRVKSGMVVSLWHFCARCIFHYGIVE